MSHYIISVGHTASGNIGCGVVDRLNESNCTREIAPLVKAGLVEQGHNCTFLQIDRPNTYLYEDCYIRAQQANAVGGDLFVEIHINAGKGNGSEVIVSSSTNSNTKKIAARVSASIAKKLNIPDRGVKENRLIVLNKTSMPAILVECLFADSSDAEKYNAPKIATAIVSGLLDREIKETTKYKIGWNENATGWWYSTDGNNFYTSKDSWKKINNVWYVFDDKGYALKHKWFKDKDKWYYFNKDCKMVAGEWVLWKDLWYFVGDDGAMIINTWHTDNNKTYYLGKDGSMQCGCTIDGKELGPDGVLIEKSTNKSKK